MSYSRISKCNTVKAQSKLSLNMTITTTITTFTAFETIIIIIITTTVSTYKYCPCHSLSEHKKSSVTSSAEHGLLK